jgi:RimJ/RimL family protein N-acetyltransferase
MMMIDQEFRQRVIDTFHIMKFEFRQYPDKVIIPVHDGSNIVARLRPLNSSFTSEEVELLAEWRNQNREAFLTWINSTNDSTKQWLTEQILPREDRILFWVETLDGIPFGHFGLTNFDFELKSCELDNVIRGKIGVLHRGILLAIQALMRWSFHYLQAGSVYVRVFSDNERAINLYMKNGLRIFKRASLRRVDQVNISRWLEVEDNTPDYVEKHVVYMKIDRDDYDNLIGENLDNKIIE